MAQVFPLSPRYRLDDESHWLEGIDNAQYYWIAVNGDPTVRVAIPGLSVSSLTELKAAIRRFRSLKPGEQMSLVRIVSASTIHCISENCYAIQVDVKGAKAWHLFDYETLESLLMTGHPDWKNSSEQFLSYQPVTVSSWKQVAVA